MLAHPQEVFKSANLANAPALKVGISLSSSTTIRQLADDQEPTKRDIKLTEEWYILHLFGGMKQIGRMMKILLKDHVIIGRGWFSFFEVEMIGKS